MRDRHSVHAAIVAVIAVGVLVVGAAPAAAGGKHGNGKGDTLRLAAEEESFAAIDVGPPGPSLGDYFVFSETLRKDGREAGTSGGQCTAVEAIPPYTTITSQCVVTLSLRRGQITLQGLVEFQTEEEMGPATLAITGGTGAYRGASGEVSVRRVSDTVVLYKLRLDSHDKHKKRKRGRH